MKKIISGNSACSEMYMTCSMQKNFYGQYVWEHYVFRFPLGDYDVLTKTHIKGSKKSCEKQIKCNHTCLTVEPLFAQCLVISSGTSTS